MTLSFISYLIICPLVFLGGLVDAIAGGGGLITLPAFLLAGLPAHNAVATNKLSSSMGTTVSTVRYARSGYLPLKPAIVGVVCSLIGSACGAKLALGINESVFRVIMLVLLVLTGAYVLFSRVSIDEKEPLPEGKTLAVCAASALVIGMYDGFYGPGTGTFLILLLTGAAHMKLTEANGTAKAINLASNYAALAVYLTNGATLVLPGLIAGVFNMAGCYTGTKLFQKNGVKVVRPVMLAVLAILFVKVALELFGVL